MESTETKMTRAVWPLLKARVSEKTETYVKLTFGEGYGSPTTMQIFKDMRLFDVREGDLLTLYTEVPIELGKGSA